jgi:hypothetical protein
MKRYSKPSTDRGEMNVGNCENGVPIGTTAAHARIKCLCRQQMRITAFRFPEASVQADAQALGSLARQLGGRNRAIRPFAAA